MYVNNPDRLQRITSTVFSADAGRPLAAQRRLPRMLIRVVCASMICACSATLFYVPAQAEEAKNDIIIEKNLFSPERKKWVSEATPGKQSADKLAKKEINDLMLMGTAIRGRERYAVLHAKKDESKGGFRPWMKGDYVQGYLLKEIEEKMVVLQDESDNKEYILYMNDEKKERVAEKTALKPEPTKPAVEDMRGDQPGKKRRARKTARQPASVDNISSTGAGAVERNVERGGGFKSAPSPDTPAPSPGNPDSLRKPYEQNDTRED
jgi:hypothetical protein